MLLLLLVCCCAISSVAPGPTGREIRSFKSFKSFKGSVTSQPVQQSTLRPRPAATNPPPQPTGDDRPTGGELPTRSNSKLCGIKNEVKSTNRSLEEVLRQLPKSGSKIVEMFKRVEGGSKSAAGEWPWLVAVSLAVMIPGMGTQRGHCGGGLIHPQWVLSAAHCFEMPSPAQIIWEKSNITIGEHNLKKQEEHQAVSSVEASRVFIHPFREVLGGMHYDFALVKLEQPVKLGKHIGLMCLPEEDETFPAGTQCSVAGWGRTAHAGLQPVPSHIHKKILSKEACETVIRENPLRYRPPYEGMVCEGLSRLGLECAWELPEDQICAGTGKELKNVCKGDSGSPLVCQKDGQYTVAGVVSWGPLCQSRGGVRPSDINLFARVTEALEWIHDTFNENNA